MVHLYGESLNKYLMMRNEFTFTLTFSLSSYNTELWFFYFTGIVIGYKNSRIVPGKTMISETSFVFFNVDICDILYFYCGTTVSHSIKYNHYSLPLILWKLKYSL